jgi:3-methylcrotonyl-CoA carboxylase alpha subunit
VQRRHQKIIEEAPAPNMPDGLREQMGETAVRAAKAINYQGAGTVEFLLDEDGSFYFMEMNTRLQVEHPVTEFITGQDLVEWQLIVACGEPLPLRQDQLKVTGHAFEARIYAEDPSNEFMPATGKLNHLSPPIENAHVRVDTGVVQGDEVSPYYDPMIAKLIVWDENRDRALARLAKALREYQISGVTTNIEFLYNLATCAPFMKADLDTGFIAKHQDLIFHRSDTDLNVYLPLASLYLLLAQAQHSDQSIRSSPASPWDVANSWRLNQPNSQQLTISINDQKFLINAENIGSLNDPKFRIKVSEKEYMVQGSLTGSILNAQVNGHRQKLNVVAKGAPHLGHYTLFSANAAVDFYVPPVDIGRQDNKSMAGNFRAPMNGTIVEVLVSTGSSVTEGEPLIIMEAMKMQHTISAPSDGEVVELFCQQGDLVDGGSELLKFTAKAEAVSETES